MSVILNPSWAFQILADWLQGQGTYNSCFKLNASAALSCRQHRFIKAA